MLVNILIAISYASLAVILALFFWKKWSWEQDILARDRTLESSRKIYQLLLEDLQFETVVQKIADAIPNELQFGTGVVAILDEQEKTIKRIAASKTPEAKAAIEALSIPFDQIKIPIDDPSNYMAKALREHSPYVTEDVYDVFRPILSKEEAAKIQYIMGTKTTLVYPIYLKDKQLGVFLASTKKAPQELTTYESYIINDFVNLVGVVLQNSKLFTSLKETTDKLEIANKKLEEVDRLKDDFVSIASHELRTPMTAIRSYVWMALFKPDIPLTEKMKKYLSRTLISTERLINLVNDMLNISRIESGRIEVIPTAFDIQKLIDDVIAEVSVKAKEKNLNVESLQNNVPLVFADPDKIHQVLLNLVGNAMKFTPEGGNITISFFSDGYLVETSIKDSGVGISPDDLSRLFKKFGRLDNSYVAAATSGGTGLGLFICKNLIELMKGKIWAKSEGMGKGTAFTFSLPVATQDVISHAEKFSLKPKAGEAKLLEPVAI